MITFQVFLANSPVDTMLWNAHLPDANTAPHQGVDIPELIVSETGRGPLAVTLVAYSGASWFPSQLQVVAEFQGEDRAIYTYDWEANSVSRTATMPPEPEPVLEPTPEPEPTPELEPECPKGYKVCRTCDAEGVVECSKCHGEGEIECKKCDGTGCVRERRRWWRVWRRR